MSVYILCLAVTPCRCHGHGGNAHFGHAVTMASGATGERGMDAAPAAWSVAACDPREAIPVDPCGAMPVDPREAMPVDPRGAMPVDPCGSMPDDMPGECSACEARAANEAAGDEGGDGACTPFGACADDCHHASGVVSGEVEVPVAAVVMPMEERRVAGIPTRVSSTPWQPPRGVILF